MWERILEFLRGHPYTTINIYNGGVLSQEEGSDQAYQEPY